MSTMLPLRFRVVGEPGVERMNGTKIVIAGLVLVGIAAAACAVMKVRRAGCPYCS